MAQKHRIDFQTILNSPFVNKLANNLSKQASSYEKKVKEVVHDLDLKSRDARQKSKKQLDRFGKQLKATRSDVESKVKSLVNHEAERLNKGFGDLVTYLKSVAKSETLRAKGKTSTKAKARANGTKRTRKAAPKSGSGRSKSRAQYASESANPQ